MRILYLANNWLGLEILKWLQKQGDHPVGLGLHPPSKRVLGDELITLAGVSSGQVFCGDAMKSLETLTLIEDLKPDLILSVLFGYILPTKILKIPPMGCINIHPAYLPYNRGAYPNVWSIVDNTPAGVTIHYMDRGIDTGAIIAQEKVAVLPTDTGATLYKKLEQASLGLFVKTWPKIKEGKVDLLNQVGKGTYHRTKDVDQIDCIDLDAKYTARHLIDVLRARTFPPHKGAFFEENGKKIYMQLALDYEEDLK